MLTVGHVVGRTCIATKERAMCSFGTVTMCYILEAMDVYKELMMFPLLERLRQWILYLGFLVNILQFGH